MQHGLEILTWEDLRPGERRHLSEEFERRGFPILTPLAVDPAHPFPFISNLSLSLAVSVRQPGEEQLRFARVKVPQTLPRWMQVPHTLRFVPLEEVIAHNLERLFPAWRCSTPAPSASPATPTCGATRRPPTTCWRRSRRSCGCRASPRWCAWRSSPRCPDWMRELLCSELEVREQDVFEVVAPLALRDLMQLTTVPLPSHRARPWTPVTHPRLHAADAEDIDIFQTIAAGDLLLHHPYDSFATSVKEFVDCAADDPAVVAIKQTLYRTSANSPIMQSLIRAAENRTQVAVTVQIKARFDEAANIEWAEALEKVGAHVAYGVVGLKTHAKLCLVVRQEGDGLRCYSHVGTGNYNSETAKLYTDLGLWTASPKVAADVAQVFNLLTGYVHQPRFRKLLVAPVNMRARFLELIAREVEQARDGKKARIVAEMNGLDDPQLVEALDQASAAGVEIDLVVRGICRLRPGAAGEERDDPRALDRRSFPRARPHLRLRQRRAAG